MRFASAKAAFRRDPNDETAAHYQAVTNEYAVRDEVSPSTIGRMKSDIEGYRKGVAAMAAAAERRNAIGAAWLASRER